MRLPETLAGAVDRYLDELCEAETFGLASQEWWQQLCSERHQAAARVWAEYFGLSYEEAYRQFALAVSVAYEHGSLWHVRVNNSGRVIGLKEIWSGTTGSPGGCGGEPVEVPEWVENTPGVIFSGTAHLVYAYVEEEE